MPLCANDERGGNEDDAKPLRATDEREEEESEEVVGRSTGPGVWAADDQDAYGEEGGGEKRARTE